MRVISGEFGGRVIKTSEGPGYRPATDKVRGAVFSMLEARGMVWSGCRVLDLFAGSGSLAMEALSRGAEKAWFVEKSPRAASLIKWNLGQFGVGPKRFRVEARDVAAVLKKTPSEVAETPFDLVFIDPPYGQDLLQPALDLLLSGGWLAEDAFVLAETEEGVKADRLSTPGLEPIIDRLYGQTRIFLWQK